MSSKHKSTRRSSTSKSYHSTSSSSSQPEPETWPVYSFLFVVDNVRANEEVGEGGVAPTVDPDGNWSPPIYAAGFGRKNRGTRMYRWRNGVVSEAAEYNRTDESWHDAEGKELVIHKCVTMFYANNFHHFRLAQGDTTSYDMATSNFPYNRWYPLTFNYAEDRVSTVDISAEYNVLPGSAGNPRNFVHQLGLAPYADRDDPQAPTTSGLAGNLAILVGLVAFSCGHRELNRILLHDRSWRDFTWRTHNRDHGQRPQRGRVISVYFDPANEVGSNASTLYELESGGWVLIR